MHTHFNITLLLKGEYRLNLSQVAYSWFKLFYFLFKRRFKWKYFWNDAVLGLPDWHQSYCIVGNSKIVSIIDSRFEAAVNHNCRLVDSDDTASTMLCIADAIPSSQRTLVRCRVLPFITITDALGEQTQSGGPKRPPVTAGLPDGWHGRRDLLVTLLLVSGNEGRWMKTRGTGLACWLDPGWWTLECPDHYNGHCGQQWRQCAGAHRPCGQRCAASDWVSIMHHSIVQ